MTRDHKFDANRGLSPSGSVLKTVEESLGRGAGGGAAPRFGGMAPEDICRKSETRWGTVARPAGGTLGPGAGCGREARDSPTVG